MNSIVAQQTTLDNALVAPDNRVKIRKCNMRISPSKKPQKEPTYQVVLDALTLSPCYPAFLITAEVLKIYMEQFWFTISKIKESSSYQFKLDKKKCRFDVEVFRDILQICPRLPNQEFDEPPSDEEIVSFFKELGYKGDIGSVTVVFTNHMHRPWRTFDAIINKCLSKKTTGLDKIRLSRAQILWGTFYRKNINFVDLIWEDFMFQIDNRDSSAKRQENMPYPRLTKAIIQHYISKEKSISIRNRMFMHSVRDDSFLGTLKFAAKSKDTQVYGALIPEEMINQKIQNSNSYKTYLAFATGEATPKKTRKWKKPASLSKKQTLVITEEPVKKHKKAPAKAERNKGIVLMSEAALLEEVQMKKAIKRSKREKHLHQAGGSDDGPGLEPEVLDEPKGNEYEYWGVSDDDDDDQEDEFVHTPEDYVPIDDDINGVDDEEYRNINEEMYDDVNVKLKDAELADEGKGDEEMTDAEKVNAEHEEVNQADASAQVKDKAQATTTAAPAQVASSSRSVSSNYGSIFLNLDNISSVETEIISMLDVQVQHENLSIHSSSLLTVPVSVIPEPIVLSSIPKTATSALATTIPPLIPHSQQLTPIPSPTTTEATTSTPAVQESETLFVIRQRVSDLEKEVKILRNIDHNIAIHATIKSEVLIVVKECLGTNLEDSLHKVIQKQTAEFIREHNVPAAVVTDELKQQQPQKSSIDIRKIKMEQASKQQETKYTITSPIKLH
ncbi:hypothetical protein Tco_0717462 [Tanacetum coccineum]